MSGAQKEDAPSKEQQILVVEDDHDLRRMMEIMLKSVADVVVASDGMDAYAMLRNGMRPSLIITDVMMPRMDGLTLVRRIKDDDELSRIPVIMLTAKGGPQDIVEGINSGARHYLTKPFKQDELVDKVKAALGKA